MNKDKLLELATILENSPHEYYQGNFYRGKSAACATPACALGHWAASHPDTWEIHTRVSEFNAEVVWLTPVLKQGGYGMPLEDAQVEFGLTSEEADYLFDESGCNGAETGKEAAQFIREFVAGERSPETDWTSSWSSSYE